MAAIESGLVRWSALLDADPATPGAGAAGATGFGLLAWGATFAPGAPAVVAGRVIVDPEAVQTVSLTELAGSGAAAMDEPARWLEDAGGRLASTFRM